MPDTETNNIKERYRKRKVQDYGDLYNFLNPYVYMWKQEFERVLISNFISPYFKPIDNKTIIEIGCGTGINLLEFIRLGFLPENLTGIELLPDRVSSAKSKLPSAVNIINDDASRIDASKNKYDIVFQSTVFTSIKNKSYQQKLADVMWELINPGGGILWYDFIYGNPRNQDVCGMPVKSIRQLFPQANIRVKKITLAPPIGRIVTRIHPSLYSLLNVFPFLRTHVLCWISKSS